MTSDLRTPALLLDATIMRANIARLQRRLSAAKVRFRPHLKTAKNVQIAFEMMQPAARSATVSTLQEAEYFADAGVRDILYAVGIEPRKIERAAALRRSGVDLTLLLDTVEQAREAANQNIPALIEIDVDGHRGGIRADSETLPQIAATLGENLRGVLAHAGGSYDSPGADALAAAAENERLQAVRAAGRLRQGGFRCPIVSVGSTPTAHFAPSMDGVTEVRAGVFVFFDLVMAGLRVCTIEDVALSVLATVIGHQQEKGWIIVDAGWMAMSRDRGTQRQAVDQGYGLVCDMDNRPYGDLIMVDANQEHGILAIRPGSKAALPALPIGSRVRILPNHACATAAQHDGYHVIGEHAGLPPYLARMRGW